MRVLVALTYYRPYTSGLTIYAERLAVGLAARGHEVTVLTSQYDSSLPQQELLRGVNVVRVPVAARISKGVIMPTFGIEATKLALTHDVLSLHMPQFDAPGLALRGRLQGKPVVLTYHCDLQLPPGWFNRIVDRVVQVSNHAAGMLATRIVAYTDDFATHSPYLSRFRHKVEIIPPPVEIPDSSDADIEAFRQRYNLQGPVIGMAARLAAEKGDEVAGFIQRIERLEFGFAVFVREKYAVLVHRLQKFNRVMKPGLNFKIPIVDTIEYVHDLRE